MTAQERITDWAALAEAATRGPWNYGTPPEGDPADTATYLTGFAIAPTAPCADVWVVWTPSDTGVIAPAITGDGPTSGPNAAHIAASRTAVPDMAAALTAVLELHQPQERCHDGDGSWSVTREEWDNDYDGEPETFLVCAHCGAIEMHESTEVGDEHSYLDALWPCPTVEIIEAALGVTP